MAICPHCHQMDKNFFAPKCHNCNHDVGFWQQVAHSLIYYLVSGAVIALGLYLIYIALT